MLYKSYESHAYDYSYHSYQLLRGFLSYPSSKK